MMTTKGLYLLPNGKDKFTLFYCNGKTKEKLYSSSYGQELVDMADIDGDAIQIALSYVIKDRIVNKRFSSARAERIFTQNNQVALLIKKIDTTLGLLLETELSKIEKPSPDDRRGYEEAVALQRKIYRDFGVAFQNAKVMTNIYADLPCALNEKPCRIFEIDKTILAVSFSECYYSDNEKLTETDLALTKYYYFDSAANYLRFLLLQLIKCNPNICLCQNCNRLFVAKTKKRTLYCDRIQPDDGKKCSEIGPKKRADLQSTLFGFEDYDKAVERNYQRAKRTEDSYFKDIKLGWDDYYAWLDRVQHAKKQWLNEEISDEVFLNIVHELD